jgi:hypothetical protein
VILLGESWGAFLRNHSSHIAAMGWFVVPTIIAIMIANLFSRASASQPAMTSSRKITWR